MLAHLRHPREYRTAIGDRSYWEPDQAEQMVKQGFEPLTPYKNKDDDPNPNSKPSQRLTKTRRLTETAIGQLTNAALYATTKARALWHLTNRLTRKLLSHTAAVVLNVRQGNSPLQLSLLTIE